MGTLGIDPGLNGALAFVEGEDLKWVMDTPSLDRAIAVGLLNQIYDCNEYGPWQMTWAVPVAIEKVHSMPRQGVASSFRFGQAYGTMLGYFSSHPITKVTPQAWKKHFGINGKKTPKEGKEAALALAIELWPHQVDYFTRKKDADRAEAALIALWHEQTTTRGT